MDLKKCTQCLQLLSTDNFYKQQQVCSSGNICKYHDSMCKICRNEYSLLRRQKIKLAAVEFLGGKCADCGLIDDPIVYDFHHLDPAQKDFSIGKQAKSFDKIKSELEKCVLLCAICHRKRHYLDKGI